MKRQVAKVEAVSFYFPMCNKIWIAARAISVSLTGVMAYFSMVCMSLIPWITDRRRKERIKFVRLVFEKIRFLI